MPLERTYLSMVEKALGEDIKLEEFETLFADDLSKKTSLMQKSRQDGGNAPLSVSGQQDVRTYRVALCKLAHRGGVVYLP